MNRGNRIEAARIPGKLATTETTGAFAPRSANAMLIVLLCSGVVLGGILFFALRRWTSDQSGQAGTVDTPGMLTFDDGTTSKHGGGNQSLGDGDGGATHDGGGSDGGSGAEGAGGDSGGGAGGTN